MNDSSSPVLIQELRARAVMAPLVRPITTSTVSIPEAPLVLIDLVCDQNIIGRAYLFGYTKVALRPLIELITNFSEILEGEEVIPLQIYDKLDETFRLLGKQGLLGMALSGLDMACWDALGKANNVSVATLLGAGGNPIAAYDSHGLFNPDTSPAHLEQTLKLGFKAVKFKIGGGDLQIDIEVLRSIRSIVGPNIKIMVDYNQSLSVPEAIERIRHLEQFNLYWVEEPVRAEDIHGHAKVREASSIAIQTGENWWFPRDAANAIAAKASDFAMLDIMKIGGITGWQQAAALAEAASTPVSSHIFVEASSHAMAATANVGMLEYLDVASSVIAEPYEIKEIGRAHV